MRLVAVQSASNMAVYVKDIKYMTAKRMASGMHTGDYVIKIMYRLYLKRNFTNRIRRFWSAFIAISRRYRNYMLCAQQFVQLKM